MQRAYNERAKTHPQEQKSQVGDIKTLGLIPDQKPEDVNIKPLPYIPHKKPRIS